MKHHNAHHLKHCASNGSLDHHIQCINNCRLNKCNVYILKEIDEQIMDGETTVIFLFKKNSNAKMKLKNATICTILK